jgi:hypothetical protein
MNFFEELMGDLKWLTCHPTNVPLVPNAATQTRSKCSHIGAEQVSGRSGLMVISSTNRTRNPIRFFIEKQKSCCYHDKKMIIRVVFIPG